MNPNESDPRSSTADLVSAVRQREDEGTARPGAQTEEPRVSLFPPQELEELRSRWQGIQAGFVDEPRRTVQEADSLVAQTVQHLAESFANERGTLESQWARGDDVSTEDLRLALRRYRAFFDRLLSA